MNKFFKKWGIVPLNLILMLLAFGPPSGALTEASQRKLNLELKKILSQSGIPESHIGAFAAFGDQVLLSQNSGKKYIPASITKLVTAASAIKHFPPGYKFKTILASSASANGEILKGDLYLVGGGDPAFVSENMWYLVNSFSRNQIKKIEGDIVVDDTLFDQQRFDLSRQKERVDRAYDAPVGAMSFNWNSVNIFIRPGAKPGDPARVYLDPENEYVRLKNLVKTTSSKTAVSADRDDDAKGVGDLIRVSGSISQNSKEIVIYKNITQPDLWSGYNLKSFLAQRGIFLTGKVRLGRVPSSAKTLAESESKPIQSILADMNKFSNNFVAEMFCKNISAASSFLKDENTSNENEVTAQSDSADKDEPQSLKAKSESPGSIQKGMKVLGQYLQGLGIASHDFELINPSGLTRENKLTAESLWKVLNDMRSDFLYQPEFMSSLPISGIDGTLKKRFKDGPGERRIRAKTGFLTGVVSLAGYAGRKDGSEIPFVFIFNGSTDESKVRAVFDKLAVALVEVE